MQVTENLTQTGFKNGEFVSLCKKVLSKTWTRSRNTDILAWCVSTLSSALTCVVFIIQLYPVTCWICPNSSIVVKRVYVFPINSVQIQGFTLIGPAEVTCSLINSSLWLRVFHESIDQAWVLHSNLLESVQFQPNERTQRKVSTPEDIVGTITRRKR